MCSSLAEASLRQCPHSDRNCVDGGRFVVIVRLVVPPLALCSNLER